MSANKLHEADLRCKYKRRLELSFVLSLSFITLIFYSFKEHNTEPPPLPEIDLKFEVVKIPQTEQFKRPPKPTQPTIPVASEDEELPDYQQIEELFNPGLNEDFALPEPEIEDEYESWAVAEKPVLLHKEVPKYPPLARKAGIEGTVSVMVVI